MEQCKKCKSKEITIHKSEKGYFFQCEDCGETFEATKGDWEK
ncbi:hypothetical protein LCGC14_1588840 [marine sediment metagenome]|uniref:Uncharacterized protein n=1 Tax=marine sediment metagenome TaxID=412755 RepID=A0A0F9KVE5_9ZZZZ